MNRQQPKTFVFEGQPRFDYLLYLPESYAANSTDRYPLILFLHGRGERGSEIEKIKVHGIPKVIEGREDFPFIAVSPQCPAESWWTMELEALDALLNEILAQYQVDTTRIYLTGLSMGGQGTWHLAMLRPDRFAAIAQYAALANLTEQAVSNTSRPGYFMARKTNGFLWKPLRSWLTRSKRLGQMYASPSIPMPGMIHGQKHTITLNCTSGF